MPLTDADIQKVADAVWARTNVDKAHMGVVLTNCLRLLQRIVAKIGA